MTRFVILVLFALIASVAGGDEPPKKLTADEQKELEAKRAARTAAGFKAADAG